ncbi:MAG: hypothetical protein ACK5LJ_00340 [Paracoccus sp. (in: a-proteobacteria)]
MEDHRRKKKWCPEMGLNRRHADFQSSEESNDNNQVSPKKYQDKARTAGEPDTLAHFRAGDAAKKNPDALAGAIGAVVQSTTLTDDNTPELPEYATAFVNAVTNLPRQDRLPLLELAIDHYRAGQPIPPLMGYMDEARFWASWASRNEIKAYAAACIERMNPAD